jgi:hypothetical protein
MREDTSSECQKRNTVHDSRGCFDVIFESGGKFGCYEGITSEFWLLDYNLSVDEVWKVYGEGGRNLRYLQNYFWDDEE